MEPITLALGRSVRLKAPTSIALAAGALLALAAPAALARTVEMAAVQQRLGVTRMSVQSLRFETQAPTLTIEVNGQRLTLELERSNLRAPGFRVLVETADGVREVPAPEPTTYRGTVPEIPGSVVGGTIQDGRLRATIALGDGRLFFVQPLNELDPESDVDQHVVYDAADVIGGQGTCAANEPQVIVPPGLDSEVGPRVAGLLTAELAFDADFEYFTQNGGNYSNTVNDIQNIMSQVNTVYERDCGITHHLTLVLIRTTAADPYTTTDAGALLNQFRDHWNSAQTAAPRDVAHLMTGKNLDGGTIGIAALGAVCNRSRAYGLSQSKFTTNNGRRVALTAHELGHNWNANHCDAVSPCNIMCSNDSGCDGMGLPNFEPMGIEAITSFAASRTCFGTPVAVDEPAGMVRFSAPTPSPFSGVTNLSFYLEQSAPAELDIFDVSGHRVVRLAEGVQQPGWHQVSWRGRDQAGRRLDAGVYYARLRFAGRTLTHKLVFLR